MTCKIRHNLLRLRDAPEDTLLEILESGCWYAEGDIVFRNGDTLISLDSPCVCSGVSDSDWNLPCRPLVIGEEILITVS